MDSIPNRFIDAWGAKLAVFIFAVATVALTLLASPWLTTRDDSLARRVNEGGPGWRTAYGEMMCTVEYAAACDAEQIGTVEAIHLVQLGAIVSIVCLGILARRNRGRVLTSVVDAIVFVGAMAAMVASVRWSWRALSPIDAGIVTSALVLAARGVLLLRWRDRSDHPGPVAIIAFFTIKTGTFAAVLGPAVAGLKPGLHELTANSVLGAPFATLACGAVLAVPVAFALLAFHPAGRGEACDWEHLRAARAAVI